MAGHKVLVVTYKGYAKELWDALSEFHDRLIPLQADDNSGPKESLPYFGGMNGSNRYNEADCVICAGLGRRKNISIEHWHSISMAVRGANSSRRVSIRVSGIQTIWRAYRK